MNSPSMCENNSLEVKMEDIENKQEKKIDLVQMNGTEEDQKEICVFYRQGKCRFGSDCFNLHEGPVVKDEPRKTSVKIVSKKKRDIEEAKYLQKKPSLRTAGDVRKRIQWDTDLPEEHFTVGYLDRFDGVVEKSFEEFSWKHLATVDLDELAIPQHRIQYYKYKGRKVWDKYLRLDNVFGSAGNDRTILEVMTEVDAEAKNKGPLSDDDDSDEEIFIVADGASGGNISGRIMQAEIQQKFEEKLRATHFLCIRVKSQEVAESIKEVQNNIVEGDPDLRSCAMPTEILHITLSMIKCLTPESIARVSSILDELRANIKTLEEYNENGNIIKAKSLSTFGARVLFSRLEVPPLFSRIVKLLQNKLEREAELILTNHFDFVPHMTLLKVNRIIARERRSKYINSALYDKYLFNDFGKIDFDNIHLCEINDCRGLDNFYLTNKIIEF